MTTLLQCFDCKRTWLCTISGAGNLITSIAAAAVFASWGVLIQQTYSSFRLHRFQPGRIGGYKYGQLLAGDRDLGPNRLHGGGL